MKHQNKDWSQAFQAEPSHWQEGKTGYLHTCPRSNEKLLKKKKKRFCRTHGSTELCGREGSPREVRELHCTHSPPERWGVKEDTSKDKSRLWNCLLRKIRNMATVGHAEATQPSSTTQVSEYYQNLSLKLSWVCSCYNPGSVEAKTGGSLWVWGHFSLQRKALCQNRHKE